MNPPEPARRFGPLLAEHRDLLPVIALGGAVGSLARWALTEVLPHPGTPGDGLVWGTLAVNVGGSATLGVLMAFVLGPLAHRRRLRPFLGVGVLGGFTTFSTWMLEVHAGLDQRPGLTLAYVGATLLLGLLAAGVGLSVTRALLRGPRPDLHARLPADSTEVQG